MIQSVRVWSESSDPRGCEVLDLIRYTLGITSVTCVKTVTVYRLEGITDAEARRFAETVLADPITQVWFANRPVELEASVTFEVAYKPGVMNPVSASLLKAAADLGMTNLVAADSSTEYHLFGEVDGAQIAQIQQALVNQTVARVVTTEPITLLIIDEPSPVQYISVHTMSDPELMALSKDALFLNVAEMRVIREFYGQLGRSASDVELEIVGVAWSEHCGHKTFNAEIIYGGNVKKPLYQRLKETSRRYFGSDVVSAFADNAGIMGFYDGFGLCIKLETHNSPSATAPYGGAATGVGGVLRDINETGQGAQVILAMDMFCFGPWNLAEEQVPRGCLHPQHLLRECVAGVGDYGNRMGVPTANGSFHFHPGFRAKPTVLVGAVGIVPLQYAQKGHPQDGQLVVLVGGRTGRDGIHGATFSSGEMTASTKLTHSSAVQIGNAIEEKRLFDALLRCRDANLIVATTDCGAGGISSAAGEMGANTGVWLELDKVPLKYSGLAPREILISESQERAVCAITPENWLAFQEICRSNNVEATVIGRFTDTKRFVTYYGGTVVGDLPMEFVHNGLPQRSMIAIPSKPVKVTRVMAEHTNLGEQIMRILQHPNICSKELVVRRYDHHVQAMNALSPYGGVYHDGPNDAIVLQPLAGKPYGAVIAHGLNPALSLIDPYRSAQWALLEALANLAAVGGNVVESVWVDNFITPYPTETVMGGLDEAMEALCDGMDAFKRPCISGKDSLSGTYRDADVIIEVPQVVCMTAMGRIPDVGKTVSADLKHPGSTLVLLGEADIANMGGSIYADQCAENGGNVPLPDLYVSVAILRALHTAISTGLVLACHDISEAGLAVTLAEMCFGGDMGVEIDLGNDAHRNDLQLFNETPCRFVVEVAAGKLEAFISCFGSLPLQIIGRTIEAKTLIINRRDTTLCQLDIYELKAVWQAPLKEVFSL